MAQLDKCLQRHHECEQWCERGTSVFLRVPENCKYLARQSSEQMPACRVSCCLQRGPVSPSITLRALQVEGMFLVKGLDQLGADDCALMLSYNVPR